MRSTVLELTGVALVVSAVSYATYLLLGVDWALAAFMGCLGAFLVSLAWALERNSKPPAPEAPSQPSAKVVNLAEKALIAQIEKDRAA